MQFAMREVAKSIIAAKFQMVLAAKQYEEAFVTRIIPMTTQRECSARVYKIHTSVRHALDAVKDAKKAGRTAGISSVTKAALYYLEWQSYVVLGEERRAEIAVSSSSVCSRG